MWCLNGSPETYTFCYNYESGQIYDNAIVTVQNNDLSSNDGEGLDLDSDIYGNATVTVTGNTISNSTGNDGIELEDAIYGNATLTIDNNDILNNDDGINLLSSSGNNITDNTISSNKWHGIWLNSNINTITGNTISNNDYGIYLNFSFFNLILKNNFLDNELDAFFINSFINHWKQNYWNKPHLLPKPIFGKIVILYREITWIQFDWHPAKEPYDIGG